MDRRLESLNHYDRLLGALFIGFFVLPLGVTLVGTVVDVGAWEPGAVFFEVLGRSLAFTVFQAGLSALVTGVLGIALGTAIAWVPGRAGTRLLAWLETLGLCVFVLPGVALALLVIDLNDVAGFPPREGWLALVCAHVFVNLALFAASVGARVRRWLDGGGREQIEAGLLLGAPLGSLRRRLLRPVWKSEARAWLPLVFFWAASNFSTLLILGGTRGRTSPEVLLFYSLLNDTDSGRLFFLLLTSLGTALVGWRLALGREEHEWSQSLAAPNGAGGWARAGILGRVGSFAAVAALSVPAGWILVSPALRLWSARGANWAELREPFGNTLALALVTGILSSLGARALLFAGSRLRRALASTVGCSSTLLGAAWIGTGIDLWGGSSPAAQLALAAGALTLVQMPLAALWIEARLRSLPTDWFEAARLLGAGEVEAKRRVAAPLLREVFARLVMMSVLAAFGELSLTGLFMRDAETLAQAARRLAQRYDFSGAAWILLAMGAASVVLSLGLARRGRRSEDALRA